MKKQNTIQDAYNFLVEQVAKAKQKGLTPSINLMSRNIAWMYNVDDVELRDLYYGFKTL